MVIVLVKRILKPSPVEGHNCPAAAKTNDVHHPITIPVGKVARVLVCSPSTVVIKAPMPGPFVDKLFPIVKAT